MSSEEEISAAKKEGLKPDAGRLSISFNSGLDEFEQFVRNLAATDNWLDASVVASRESVALADTRVAAEILVYKFA